MAQVYTKRHPPKKNFEVTTSVIETNSTYDTKDM